MCVSHPDLWLHILTNIYSSEGRRLGNKYMAKRHIIFMFRVRRRCTSVYVISQRIRRKVKQNITVVSKNRQP